MINWISTEDQLPEHNEIVLIYEPNTNVFHADMLPSRMHVVQFVRGKIPKPGESWCSADVGFNNEKPYYWDGDGPCSWVGQAVTYWSKLHVPEQHSEEHLILYLKKRGDLPSLNYIGEEILSRKVRIDGQKHWFGCSSEELQEIIEAAGLTEETVYG